MPHRNLDTVDKLTTDQHWQNYADFCRYDMLAGGPDSHMTLAGYMNMSRDLSEMERLWHAGVYVGVYNVPTAELLWTVFPHKEMLKISNKDLTAWLTDNWQGIATRTERKCVRVPANMAYYLKNYAEWILTLPNRYDDDTGTAESRYEDMWEYSQKSVKFLGRYSGFKLLEYMTRYCNMPINLPDIRPVGGWSPRTMLSVLYPEHKEILLGPDTMANLKTINGLAADLLATMNDNGIVLNNYKMEVFLCDYKQCYFGRRQYPGRSQDSEITYLKKLSAYWDYDFQMLKARSEIFPHWALGELNGWETVRKELGTVLYDYDYMWSDGLYDYKNTMDLSIPTGKFCNV